jgi:hypothetical protein
MLDVIAGGPGLVAVGNDSGYPSVWTSTTGAHWTEHVVGSRSDLGVQAAMVAVARAGPGFVAVGSRGGDAEVWVSKDGARWNAIPEVASFRRAVLHDVVLWRGKIVAGGQRPVGLGQEDAAVWTSIDGIAWTLSPDPTGAFGDLGASSGQLSNAPQQVQQVITSLTADGGRIVAVGWEGTYRTQQLSRPAAWVSPDALRWTRAPARGVLSLSNGGGMEAVIRSGSVFVAVGAANRVDAGVWMSGDGLSWVQAYRTWETFGPQSQFTGTRMTGLAARGKTLLIVGAVPQPGVPGQPRAAIWRGTPAS